MEFIWCLHLPHSWNVLAAYSTASPFTPISPRICWRWRYFMLQHATQHNPAHLSCHHQFITSIVFVLQRVPTRLLRLRARTRIPPRLRTRPRPRNEYTMRSSLFLFWTEPCHLLRPCRFVAAVIISNPTHVMLAEFWTASQTLPYLPHLHCSVVDSL
jgi:hypothetical protein